jgi:hypothetical protein
MCSEPASVGPSAEDFADLKAAALLEHLQTAYPFVQGRAIHAYVEYLADLTGREIVDWHLVLRGWQSIQRGEFTEEFVSLAIFGMPREPKNQKELCAALLGKNTAAMRFPGI